MSNKVAHDALPILLAARFRAIHERPYFASILLRLRFVPVKDLGTLGVDYGWRLFYDPDLTWTAEETVAVLFHEINHLLRDHFARASQILNVNVDVWNKAADCEINDDFDYRFKLPSYPNFMPCTPDAFGFARNKLAEEYYNELLKDAKSLAIYLNGPTIPGYGKCGSCMGGKQSDIEKTISASVSNLPPPVSGVEQELVKLEVAKEIAKQPGSIPGHLKRWAEIKLKPKIDWRKELIAALRWTSVAIKGAAIDYSYCRPSRKQSAMPHVVLPCMVEPVVRKGILLDTSGSMSQSRLEHSLAEISGILSIAGMLDGTEFFSCDSTVNLAKKVFNVSQVEMVGGGGTDMTEGIAIAAGEKPLQSGEHEKFVRPPDVLIVISDGETGWPATKPRSIKKVIIVLVGTTPDAPSWARVIKVPNDEAA